MSLHASSGSRYSQCSRGEDMVAGTLKAGISPPLSSIVQLKAIDMKVRHKKVSGECSLLRYSSVNFLAFGSGRLIIADSERMYGRCIKMDVITMNLRLYGFQKLEKSS